MQLSDIKYKIILNNFVFFLYVLLRQCIGDIDKMEVPNKKNVWV